MSGEAGVLKEGVDQCKVGRDGNKKKKKTERGVSGRAEILVWRR